MSILLQKIADPDNLYWAWEKAKNIYQPGDVWYNELAVASFEGVLSDELAKIRSEILNGTYTLSPIQPVAYPKAADTNGSRTRQTFWVSVRDQITWLAVVNIIGRYIDAQMPSWSYGNRLYISMFYEENIITGQGELQFGYYRNTTRKLYRKWNQSWPLYRRHINITAKYLTKQEQQVRMELDEQELRILEQNQKMSGHPLKSTYLSSSYWKNRTSSGLFWAGLDLEKFYPQLNLSVVKNNIIQYLPPGYRSDLFNKLLDRLLNFQTDLSGWTEEELNLITLDAKPGSYEHLPTGLFVAGFLANVALLQVDKKIQTRLLKNRNVAHFRYVDDHVILATSFEQLITWINEYRIIIKDSQIGTTFNPEKTEPKALAEYYQSINDNDGTVSDKRKKAEDQCRLDPDFPTPLMTQTLGKVSRIAGTPFNLLSPDEEKTMIADIEHLLMTEFPDHELRKDTRVSFAARMLSVLSPQMSPDNSEAYRLHRNIFLKQQSVVDIIKQEPKKGIDDDLRAKLALQKAELEASVRQHQQDLIAEELRLKKLEDQLAARTIKLLIKAIQDNHDKVRLWSRIVEFFLKSGYVKLSVVFSTLRKLESEKVSNRLSLTFVHALLGQMLSSLLFEALRIIDSAYYPQRRKARAFKFVSNVLDDEVFDYFKNTLGKSKKSYERVSYELFCFSCGAILRILNDHFFKEKEKLNEDFIEKYQLIDFRNKPGKFMDKTLYPRGVWAWWLYSMLPERPENKTPYLWSSICATFKYQAEIDINTVLQYPAHIYKEQMIRLNNCSFSQLASNEGLLYEIYKNYKHQPRKPRLVKNGPLSKLSKKINSQKKNRDIGQWIDWTAEQQRKLILRENEPVHFDPRMGEWVALEIIRQIAEEVKSKQSTFDIAHSARIVPYYKYIHPYNFKIPAKWFDENKLTWESLTILLGNGKNVVALKSMSELIIDSRFAPQFGLNQENENQSIIRALGTLFIMLLAKSTHLPPRWNLLGMQQAGLYLSAYKLRDLPISTYSRDIVGGCFSKRNIETQFNKGLVELLFDYKVDTAADPPEFNIIEDFIKQVEFALSRLKRQQLSVSEHQPRQLTPISIMQLKRKDYQELLDEKHEPEQ